MKERPILFSGEMVRAILDGRKTQTRRYITQLECSKEERDSWKCKFGQPGDRLWVRETFYHPGINFKGPVIYAADYPTGGTFGVKLKPSIHMPRWASRITLEITAVRVERLQDINRGDVMAEGCPFLNMAKGPDPRQWYRELWEKINGPGSWDKNPWVWVIEFKRLEKNL